jgi:hypothetical protein
VAQERPESDSQLLLSCIYGQGDEREKRERGLIVSSCVIIILVVDTIVSCTQVERERERTQKRKCKAFVNGG